MKYSKSTFGLELLQKLKKEPFDVVGLSKWCELIYAANAGKIDDELRELLLELSTMKDDPQFECTQEELEALANKLINEETGLLDIPTATILDDHWIICPSCSDAWEESNSVKPIILCPKCGAAFHNPQYRKEFEG